MKKFTNLKLLMVVLLLVPLFIYADSCVQSNSASGYDSGPTVVTISSFPCTGGGTITAMNLNATIGSYCPSWYTYDIIVNGITIATNQCNQTGYNLTPYLPITSVSLQSVDEDVYSDYITLSLTLNITYTPPLDHCYTCPTYDFGILTPTPVSQTHSSSFGSSYCKIYAFGLVSGKEYVFKTGCGDGATADFDTYIELYNASCTLVASNDDGCESNRSTITYTAAATTTHYLKVMGFSGAGGNYTLAYYMNEMYVPYTGNNSYTVCSGHLYDHGGSAANYLDNANGYTVLYPSVGGNMIQVSGSQDTESGYDYVRIYNGIGTGGMQLYSNSGTQTIPTLTSTDASGALTS